MDRQLYKQKNSFLIYIIGRIPFGINYHSEFFFVSYFNRTNSVCTMI